MDITAMLDALNSAYETLERPQISGLKTIHAKTAVDRTLQAEFDAALSRISSSLTQGAHKRYAQTQK
jgi:hypothetical protein